MVCKNCGNPLDDGVKFCTKCGQRVEEVVAEVKEAAAEVKEEVTEATAEVKETVAEAQETVAEAKEDANDVKEKVADVAEEVKETVTEVAADVKEAVEGAKEKVKKFPKAVWIALAAIVVVLVLIVANFKTVANSVNKLVSSEEKYYASVEKDQIKELASSVSTIYDNTILENIDYNNLSMEYGVEVELSEDAYEMLAAALEVEDGKPFSKMAADFFLSFKGDVISAEASATLGKTQLITADGVANLKKGEAYGRIEELSSKYIGVSFEEYAELISESLKQSDEITKLFPKKKTVEKLINRYLAIAVENVDNVTEKKDTIKVGDIEQKCTSIRVRIKERDMKNIAVAILEEAKDDKDLLNLATDFAVAMAEMEGEEDVDAKEVKEMLQAQIEMAYEQAKEAEVDPESEEEIIMMVWVNGKGEVIGREVKVNDETLFVYKMPEKGSKFEFKGSIVDGKTEYILEGEGKKSSSSLNGEFTFKLKTQEYDWDTDEYVDKTYKMFEVAVDKFDTEKIKEGFLNGSFTFKLSKDFMEEADMGVASAIIGNYQLKYDVSSSKNNASVEMSLMNKKETFAKIALDAKIGSGKSASLPKGILVEDQEDIIEWAKTINFDKFIKKLEKAGIPVEIVEEIEDYCDNIEDVLSNY